MSAPAEYDPRCAFCRIASGADKDAKQIASSPHWVAIFPLQPATLGHTLILPTQHVQDFWAAPADMAAELANAAVLVGNALKAALNPDGLNLISSAGEVAEQTIFHLHLHVVPRWENDGFGKIWPSKQERYSDEQLEDLAQTLRSACKGDL